MQCPKCNDSALMTVISEEAFPLDFCLNCYGIWFDQGETAKQFSLSEDIPAQALQSARKTGFICPRCAEKLRQLAVDLDTPQARLSRAIQKLRDEDVVKKLP